jgi:phosphomannomutase
MLAKQNADLAEMRSEFERYHSVVEQVPCGWSKKGQVMRLLMEYTEGKNRQLVDGARFQSDADWVWIAPDRNAAYFTVVAESEDRERAVALAAKYREQVGQWQK